MGLLAAWPASHQQTWLVAGAPQSAQMACGPRWFAVKPIVGPTKYRAALPFGPSNASKDPAGTEGVADEYLLHPFVLLLGDRSCCGSALFNALPQTVDHAHHVGAAGEGATGR